jgi:hypothetical protein
MQKNCIIIAEVLEVLDFGADAPPPIKNEMRRGDVEGRKPS